MRKFKIVDCGNKWCSSTVAYNEKEMDIDEAKGFLSKLQKELFKGSLEELNKLNSKEVADEWYVVFEEIFEPCVKQPQPVDLSTVKVGEKYVIGGFGYSRILNLKEGFDYYGGYGSYDNCPVETFNVGDVVEIRKDIDEICLFKDGNYSYCVKDDRFTLYPYTEPSEPLQDDKQLYLGVTPENENISTEEEYTPLEVSSQNLEHARKCYNGYLKVAKMFHRDSASFIEIFNEDEKIEFLESSLWWVDDAIQDKICNILGLNLFEVETGDIILRILHDSFKDMEDFDMIIDRLRLNNIIK